MNQNPSERRSCGRRKYFQEVNLSNRDGLLLPPPRTTDISEGGARLTGLTLPVASEVKVFIPVPSSKGKKSLLLLEARVAWRKLGSIGLQFVSVPTDAKESLQCLVSMGKIAVQ